MLIPFSTIVSKYPIDKTKSILHIGAHNCEERHDYKHEGFGDDKVIWLEGNKDIVTQINITNPEINIHQVLVSNKDDEEVTFIITNNGQSSSILELQEHLIEHPSIHEVNRYTTLTTTVDTFLKHIDIVSTKIDFVNIDIQGAELLALKGMINLLKHCRYLYLEVNTKHLYKDCALIDEIDEFLIGFNFQRTETCMTKHGWGDALYVKNE